MRWLRRSGDRYIRQWSDYIPPQNVLWLDGTLGWNTVTGWDNLRLFNGLPADVELAVEAVTEPGNPHDNHAVALDINGTRIGYLHRENANTMFPLIQQVNRLGFRVFLRGKVTESKYRRSTYRDLELRGTSPGDLLTWLHMPATVRGYEYFEIEWTKTDYERFYQWQRQAFVSTTDIVISGCLFGTDSRRANPYVGYSSGPAGSPVPPKVGTYVDIFVDGQHVGELRQLSIHHGRGVVDRVRASATGWAMLRRWPDDFIKLKVAIADSNGAFPRSAERFLWRAEKAEAERQSFERRNLAEQAETVDGTSLGRCQVRLAELKRSGDLAAARSLALKMVDAMYTGAQIRGGTPLVGVILDVAIVFRKVKDIDREVAVLQRYVDSCPVAELDKRVVDRLAKARALAAKLAEPPDNR